MSEKHPDPAWLNLLDWLDDPDRDPSEWVYIDDGVTGWVRGSEIAIGARPAKRERAPRKVAPLAPRDDRLLTLAEAGDLVRASSETVRFWIWQGRLTAYKPGRAVLVRESELLELVATRETRSIRAERAKKARSR